MNLVRCSVVLSALFAGAAHAADPARIPVAPPAAFGIGSLLQVLLALGLVLGAIYGVAWLLRRLGPLQNPGATALCVVAAAPVGQRERIVVIEVEDTWLVVGVAPGSVNALHTLPRPAQGSVKATPVAPPSQGDRFDQWLKSTLSRNRQ